MGQAIRFEHQSSSPAKSPVGLCVVAWVLSCSNPEYRGVMRPEIEVAGVNCYREGTASTDPKKWKIRLRAWKWFDVPEQIQKKGVAHLGKEWLYLIAPSKSGTKRAKLGEIVFVRWRKGCKVYPKLTKEDIEMINNVCVEESLKEHPMYRENAPWRGEKIRKWALRDITAQIVHLRTLDDVGFRWQMEAWCEDFDKRLSGQRTTPSDVDEVRAKWLVKNFMREVSDLYNTAKRMDSLCVEATVMMQALKDAFGNCGLTSLLCTAPRQFPKHSTTEQLARIGKFTSCCSETVESLSFHNGKPLETLSQIPCGPSECVHDCKDVLIRKGNDHSRRTLSWTYLGGSTEAAGSLAPLTALDSASDSATEPTCCHGKFEECSIVKAVEELVSEFWIRYRHRLSWMPAFKENGEVKSPYRGRFLRHGGMHEKGVRCTAAPRRHRLLPPDDSQKRLPIVREEMTTRVRNKKETPK